LPPGIFSLTFLFTTLLMVPLADEGTPALPVALLTSVDVPS
jgi:hypothetical protein